MASSKKDTHLYNPRTHNLKGGKELSSSNSQAFTSNLSSLISATHSRPAKATSARLGPKKDDLFKRPNRNVAKRAKLDHDNSAEGPFEQRHTTDGEGVEKGIWERSQRAMERKAKLYAAMKRGDVEDLEGKYDVDFDKKWEDEGRDDASSSDLDEGEKDEEEEMVTYIDSFGRSRTGTRAEAAREQRMQAAQQDLDSDRFVARPHAPSNVIYGDTIQHAAFAPDAVVSEQMETLARKRDRSLTPPAEEHFDADREVREKGTGFFRFSGDAEERARQMEGLEEERRETERVRAEGRREKADEFLEGLGEEIASRNSGVKRRAGENGGVEDGTEEKTWSRWVVDWR